MSTTTLRFYALLLIALVAAVYCAAQVGQVQSIAPDVYFHQGDLVRRGHCNNGWVVFDDYVLVIDGNFPSGAQEVLPKIKAATDRPIRFAFDTHHHGDHAYGNQFWANEGATIVAHTGVLEEMKKYETGLFGDKPGRWEDTAKGRKDVAESKLKPPSLLYRTDMIFDDGKHRVELLHFGVAHTHGDGFAWLPKERILFTGDACVNGPFNFVGDGNIHDWIKTLDGARKLNPKMVCPGHGASAGPELLEQQQMYFVTLRDEVKRLHDAKKSPDEVKAAIETIKAAIQQNEKIAKYVGGSFPNHVEKVYVEMGGKPFLEKTANAADRATHSTDHGALAKK